MAIQKTVAVVLAGAVANGAFEAGVIRALAEAELRIVRIVAASSGALNGTLLASAVRSRTVAAGAQALHALWRDHADWTDVFHASLRALVADRDGLSDQTKLRALLRAHVQPSHPPDAAEINLRIVVAPLDGVSATIGDAPATTFEALRDFDTTAFATEHGLDAVFDAATASAAFPVVFSPVELAGLGPCVDGGMVNNTPLKWALDGAVGATVDAVIVVSTAVEHRTAPAHDLHGLGLVGHLGDLLVDERLYRDLREATEINATLRRLDGLVEHGVLDRGQLAKVLDALGWSGRRTVELVRIRPAEALRGSPFSGFFSKELRVEQLALGYARGRAVLGALAW